MTRRSLPLESLGRAVPDVSVLMSTISVDRWLTEAAESILDQQDVDLELILVLDGARAEGQPAWIRDRRVKILVNPHRTGLSNALKAAAVAGKGQYFARMDADDVSAPARLSTLQNYLESNADASVVGTAASLIDSSGRVVGESLAPATHDARRALVVKNRLVHPSVMIRRSAYEKVGGYRRDLRQMEDYDLWLRMAMVGRVAVLPERLLLYRVHANQMSRGAAPHGAHVAAISRGQYRLGRALGMSVASVSAAIVRWRLAQYARYYGILEPGYDKAARQSRPGSAVTDA
ncbi:glycosyltransferase [Blastococcus sp. SYSU D00922]